MTPAAAYLAGAGTATATALAVTLVALTVEARMNRWKR